MAKISIITINYNDKIGLEKTVNSVVNQTYTDFEFLIIDGGSTDGSKEIIKKYKERINYWVCETDSGIYNAMNKGIKAANGDYLLFLNSGDWFYCNDTLANVDKLIDCKFDIYYGNAVFKFDKKDKIVKYDEKISFYFFTQNSFCHQATFIKRKLFYDIFFYNENLKIVSDWEFFVYAICIKNVSIKYIDLIIVNYNFQGISSRPETEIIKISERQQVYLKYFPMYIEDYKNIEIVNSKRIQNILHIKKFLFAWTILKGILNLFLLVLPKKIKN